VLESVVEIGAHGTGLAGHGESRLYLAENLRLAQHQGVEPAGHPHHMGNGLILAQVVNAGHQIFQRQPLVIRQPAQQAGIAAVAEGVNLGAIAGGEDHHLIKARCLAGVIQHLRDFFRRKRHPFPQCYGSGVMIDAQHGKMH